MFINLLYVCLFPLDLFKLGSDDGPVNRDHLITLKLTTVINKDMIYLTFFSQKTIYLSLKSRLEDLFGNPLIKL